MNSLDLDTELRRTMAVQGLPGTDGRTEGHLYDRMEGFLSALSFTPVATDADAALRAHHLTALIECVQEMFAAGDDVAPADLRLGWRLADTLTEYLEAKAGLGVMTGRQTAEMEDLLRRSGS